MSNEFEISYELPGSKVGGVHKQVVSAASETDARNIVRAHFGDNQEVRVVGGRMTSFGGGRDEDRRDRNR